MPHPTRVPRVVLLGAIVLFSACADEPAPQHPTHTAKKKHKKKHADADVAVTDDTDADASEDTHEHPDREVAASDHEEPKKKRHKATKSSDDENTKKTGREDTKRRHEADDDRDTTKPAGDETKKRGDDEDAENSDPKKDGDDGAKKSDGAETTKPGHEHTAKREPKKATKHASKRKPSRTPKPAKTEPASNASAGEGEIEMDEDPLAGEGQQATAEPATSADGETDAAAAVAAPMPAPAPATSPLAINDRALVVRHGALEVHGGLRTAVLTLPGLMPGTTTSTTSEGLALGATYGVGDKIEIGGDYVASISPGSIKGPLTLHAAYLAVVGPKLDVAVAGALAIDFLDSTDPTTHVTTTTTAYGLQLGGWVRYRVAPKIALFTGLPALPASTASLSKQSFALPPLPYQLAIGLSNGSAIALDVPAGVGFQAAPTIYAFAMTDLAHVRFSNTANAFLFADFIPVTVGGFYSRDKLDLGATFADDLKQGTGYLSFELLARYALP